MSIEDLANGHHDFDPNPSNSARPFIGVAAGESGRLAFHFPTLSIGIVAGDTGRLWPLTAKAFWSLLNTEASTSSSVAALYPAAAESPVDVCAIKCIDSFARVEEEGWIYWLKNSSMSFFVSGSMCSTSWYTGVLNHPVSQLIGAIVEWVWK